MSSTSEGGFPGPLINAVRRGFRAVLQNLPTLRNRRKDSRSAELGKSRTGYKAPMSISKGESGGMQTIGEHVQLQASQINLTNILREVLSLRCPGGLRSHGMGKPLQSRVPHGSPPPGLALVELKT
jgi:hypothetical protein